MRVFRRDTDYKVSVRNAAKIIDLQQWRYAYKKQKVLPLETELSVILSELDVIELVVSKWPVQWSPAEEIIAYWIREWCRF